MSSVWAAFLTGNVYKCQQMPAYVGVRTAYSSYDQRTLRVTSVLCVWPAYVGVRTAYSAYDQRMSAYDQRTLRIATVIIRKLYVKYVTQSSGIHQDVYIRCRYARHTLEVRYSYAINTLAVRYCTIAVMVHLNAKVLQRMSTVLDLWVTYPYRTSSVISVCLAYA